jgi:putative transposase
MKMEALFSAEYPDVTVQGRWCDLYRAVDRDGTLVDAQPSDTRDLAAAEAFFRSAWTVPGVTPGRITTDGLHAYPRAIRNAFGERVMPRITRYVSNDLEQDHRGITQRYRPMCGLKTFARAAYFCRVFDEIRAFLRPQSHRNQPVTLAPRRAIPRDRFAQLMGMITAA